MAVDEALLHSAAEANLAVLRLYQWSAPTLSLGYFQSLTDLRLHGASAACAVVRRASGGGAILHDRELTYSLSLPAGHPWAADAAALYGAVHRALIAALSADVSQAPTLCETADDSRPRPFLCFQRRALGDVLLEGQFSPTGSLRQRFKIAGSAQRRGKGAILQHGSILLEKSTAAPELPGWRDLSGKFLSAEDLTERFTSRLARALSLATRPDGLTRTERNAAEGIVRDKYGHPGWTARR